MKGSQLNSYLSKSSSKDGFAFNFSYFSLSNLIFASASIALKKF